MLILLVIEMLFLLGDLANISKTISSACPFYSTLWKRDWFTGKQLYRLLSVRKTDWSWIRIQTVTFDFLSDVSSFYSADFLELIYFPGKFYAALISQITVLF